MLFGTECRGFPGGCRQNSMDGNDSNKNFKKNQTGTSSCCELWKTQKMYVDGKNHRSLCQTVTIAKHGYFFVYVVVCCWFYKMSKCHGNNNIA